MATGRHHRLRARPVRFTLPALESPGGSAQGANLDQSTDTAGDNQWWKLVPSKTNGYYRLVNVRNGWCADVKDASTLDSAYVIQWPTTDGANQDWQLVAL